MSNKLEQLEFKLEKNIGIQKYAGKVRKDTFLCVEIVKSIRLYSLVSIEVRERQKNLIRYFATTIELTCN